MAWLTSDGDLPCQPKRILIAGTSGSGKSTLARRVAALTHNPYVELDALRHGPQWSPRPEFLTDVTRLSEEDRWTTEWQYPAARPLLASRADLLIFLDLPRLLVMTRVVRRTLQRRLRRTELWNGNIEPPLHTFFHDSDHIVRWAWRTHDEHRRRVEALAKQQPTLPIVHLFSRRQVNRWVVGPLARAVLGPGTH